MFIKYTNSMSFNPIQKTSETNVHSKNESVKSTLKEFGQ